MDKVKDYNELERLDIVEGKEILVLYSNLIYRGVGGGWQLAGKVTAEGKIVYVR